MPPFPPCPKMKPQIYGAVPDATNPKMAYALAHSARCKLALSANRPDRNLRMVLGHAFALDNLLVRIVEIENDSAANGFDNSQPEAEQPLHSEIADRDKKIAGIGGGAGVTVGETGSLARPQTEQQQQGRRISFGNSADFRPSEYNGSNGSAQRRKSPPPKKVVPKGYEDEESTSSDDYDDDLDPTDFARTQAPQAPIRSNLSDMPPQDPYEDAEDDDSSLGLTRFQSASARRTRSPPRKAPSPPPEEVPALEADLSDDEEPEDRAEPPSPPAFADDVLRSAMTEGDKDEELGDLYETLRGCPCCKQHGSAPKKSGVWRVKAEGGKQYAVLAEEQENALGHQHEHVHEIAVSA